MNTSGKSTAAQATVDFGNFSPDARHCGKLSAPGIIRMANRTKKEVRIEDGHRFHPQDGIFDFIVNSFKRDGKHVVANLNDQARYIAYQIGGCPVVFTTHNTGKLDQDVRRRCILLPMIRSKPKRYATDVERDEALAPIRQAIEAAGADWARPRARASGRVKRWWRSTSATPCPSGMNEVQRHKCCLCSRSAVGCWARRGASGSRRRRVTSRA
jgi:hypothetical protein